MIWETLTFTQRLILLKKLVSRGTSGQLYTYTGALPATITAVAHAIQSLTRYGLCTQDGTPTPDAPVDIVTNNGALKYSANMANVNEQTASVGYYINAQGAVLADIYNWMYSAFIPVKPNTTYTLSMSQSVYFVSISEYSTAEDSGFIVRKVGRTGSNTSLTITTEANTNFIRFGSNLDRLEVTLEKVLGINWMLNVGGTAMDYQPYVEGGIYCGGTHTGQNLVDLSAVTDDYYYDPNGVYTAVANARLTDYIPVRAGQKYTVYVKAQQGGTANNVRCNLFNAAKTWKSQSVFVVNSGSEGVRTITPAENGYLRVSANYTGTGAKVDWSTLQVVRGEYTVATMPPYEPYKEIPYEPEVLTISGINLLDPSPSNIVIGESISVEGPPVTAANNWRTEYIPVVGGKTYIFYGRRKSDNVISAFNRMNFYTADKTFISPRPPYEQNTPTVATAPSNAAYVRLSSAPYNSQNPVTRDTFDAFNWMFTEGSAEISFEPYVTPQTVTVPMLLGVGDYKDAAELISGIKTGKVGIKVFDGTEDFTVSSSGAMITTIPDVAIGAENNPMNTRFDLETSPTSIAAGTQRFGASGTQIYSSNYYMKHPTITTAPDFKVWLASLFAAGTPDIMVYPKATETTEQTAQHNLVTHKGVNVVDSTANVEPVEAKIEYYGTEAPMLGMMMPAPSAPEEPTDEPETEEEGGDDAR